MDALPPPGGVIDEWKVITVEIPQMNLNSSGELDSSEAFRGEFRISFPLTIGGRTFDKWYDFWQATGVGNFMVSIPALSNRFVGFTGASIAASGGAISIVQRGNNYFSGGTMYIYCRFTD